jgi:glucuronide carrier protein
MVAGGLIVFVSPPTTVWLAFGGLVLCQVGVLLVNMLVWALEADTVEYGEWKTGQRTEGATYAIFSFTRKITQSIGGALGAFALAIGGYITKLAAGEVQPESAITAIKASIGLVPAAAAILAMLAFIAYPLTEKKYRDIIAENDARKQKFLEQQNIATVPIPPGI